MELRTKRLILRPWKDEDAASLYKYAQNPNIGPHAGWQPHTSMENSLNIIRTVLTSSVDEIYAIVLKETNEVIGGTGLMLVKTEINSVQMKENEGEIGYWIAEPFWGAGLAPEATRELLRHGFDDLGLSAIWCAYYEGNEKSKRVQQKCGFTFHHVEYEKFLPMMNEKRTEYYSYMPRSRWENQKLIAQ